VKNVPSRRPKKTSTHQEVSTLGRIVDVQDRLRRHPYQTLGATVGLGYVLGGGVFTSLTSRLVRLGLRAGTRFALVALVADHVARLITAPAGEHHDAKDARLNGGAR
jgi:hypothetical protein